LHFATVVDTMLLGDPIWLDETGARIEKNHRNSFERLDGSQAYGY
jgi:hypothetical protein